MPIYALGDLAPTIDPSAYIHPDAVIVGDVRIGPESSIWPCVVLRGDHGYISIGSQTSVQDGSVLHTTPHVPTIVGDGCVIGHMVHLEGCVIESGSLVGSGAIVLAEAVVRSGAVVGANAVVTNRMVVPPGAVALGIPAKLREGAADPNMIRVAREAYMWRAQRYRHDLRRLD